MRRHDFVRYEAFLTMREEEDIHLIFYMDYGMIPSNMTGDKTSEA